MPPKHDKPLKMRAYKLSDDTVELIRLIADALTEEQGRQCNMTDAVRIAIQDKASVMGLKLSKKKK